MYIVFCGVANAVSVFVQERNKLLRHRELLRTDVLDSPVHGSAWEERLYFRRKLRERPANRSTRPQRTSSRAPHNFTAMRLLAATSPPPMPPPCPSSRRPSCPPSSRRMNCTTCWGPPT